jgi:hypothetical protein
MEVFCMKKMVAMVALICCLFCSGYADTSRLPFYISGYDAAAQVLMAPRIENSEYKGFEYELSDEQIIYHVADGVWVALLTEGGITCRGGYVLGDGQKAFLPFVASCIALGSYINPVDQNTIGMIYMSCATVMRSGKDAEYHIGINAYFKVSKTDEGLLRFDCVNGDN